jgi:hypothetical protein
METISIYKNMEVTYGELETALLTLHYIKKRGKDFYGFENKTFDSVVLIPLTVQPEEKVSRLLFDSTSKLLEAKGVIAHKDDLAKMIECERLAAQQRVA